MDLSKAFDSVLHDLLMSKTYASEFSINDVTFFYSCLKRQNQNVRIIAYFKYFYLVLLLSTFQVLSSSTFILSTFISSTSISSTFISSNFIILFKYIYFKYFCQVLLSLLLPQCSILDPFLFNIFIHDLYLWITKTDLLNFADDNTISAAERTIEILISTLETESQTAIKWFKLNEMIINPEKFQAIVVKKNAKMKNSYPLNNK